MSEENKIGTYQFVAEPFHVDFNGRLTMGCWESSAELRRFSCKRPWLWYCDTERGQLHMGALAPGYRIGRNALSIREFLGSDMGGKCLSSVY